MRTTLTIDDDVLLAAKERARSERRTTGQVLSDLARLALTADPADDVEFIVLENGFRVLPHRGAPVTDELVYQILEEEGI